NDADHEQRRRHRPPNEWFGNTHGFPDLAIFCPNCLTCTGRAGFDGCGVVSSTCAPGCNLYCPSTTTCSPGSSPSSTNARFPSVCATLIGRISTVLSGLIRYAYVP